MLKNNVQNTKKERIRTAPIRSGTNDKGRHSQKALEDAGRFFGWIKIWFSSFWEKHLRLEEEELLAVVPIEL